MMVSRFAFCLLSAVFLSGCDGADNSSTSSPVRPVKTQLVMPAMNREPVSLTGRFARMKKRYWVSVWMDVCLIVWWMSVHP
ncbi:hypothetical protein [Pectobacterium versatile]|uniref:hypothetical protein n=1 Tax=Pectobacterium versatile TaxID=2488639 RepID=UPI001E30B52C|nr:hypothetical protein [Pectobacterium versatile]